MEAVARFLDQLIFSERQETLMILSLLPQMMLLSLGVLAGLIVSSLVLLRSLFLFITIEGGSMSPTLESQDRVLVLRTWAAEGSRKDRSFS
jgi:signal peptidase I